MLTADRIKDAIQERRGASRDAPEDFLAFVCEQLDGYRRREQLGTYRAYMTSFRKFKAFIEAEYGREKVPFDALDARLFRAFRTYCYKTCENKTNTVGKALDVMRTLVRLAMKESSRGIPSSTSPSTAIPPKKSFSPPRRLSRLRRSSWRTKTARRRRCAAGFCLPTTRAGRAFRT